MSPPCYRRLVILGLARTGDLWKGDKKGKERFFRGRGGSTVLRTVSLIHFLSQNMPLLYTL